MAAADALPDTFPAVRLELFSMQPQTGSQNFGAFAMIAQPTGRSIPQGTEAVSVRRQRTRHTVHGGPWLPHSTEESRPQLQDQFPVSS